MNFIRKIIGGLDHVKQKVRKGGRAVMIEHLEPRELFSTYMVINLANSGAGSLRQQVLNANAHAGADVVTFSPKLAGTITLTTGQITVSGGVNIMGPGSAKISVSGNNASRIFNVAAGASTPVAFGGLTLTRGNPGSGAGGGAIRNDGALTVSGVVFANNVAASITTNNSGAHPAAFGGAGLMNYGAANVVNCTFSNNAVYAHDANFLDGGGGIYNAGALKVTHSAFFGNIADESPTAPQHGPNTEPMPWGAAIYDNGTLTLTDSTLYGNYSNAGGALAVGPYASATVINDTIAANASDYTGGIKLEDAYTGSGIAHEGKLTIGNTIVAGNSVLIDPTLDDIGNILSGSITSLGHNLIGVTIEPVWTSTDLTGAVATPRNAKLSPLASNGGPTKTAALLSSSPAINAGSNSIATMFGLTTDQRGIGRVRFGTVDIGAYES